MKHPNPADFPANQALDPHNESRGAFVRGFFCELRDLGIDAAVLHGWQGGFTGELSDVDFVIGRKEFVHVTAIISAYCNRVGWRVCQVFRHESTAAYCVCAREDDPSVVVALDACSDYRSNERLLIAAEEFLANRSGLPWGGFRLSDAYELRYRFLKAAVKRKNASALAHELASYSETARSECSRWLRNRWELDFHDWSIDAMATAWKLLDKRMSHGKPEVSWRAIVRIIRRLIEPTGLIVIGNFDEQAVLSCYGRLYFRRWISRDRGTLSCLRFLPFSTLICLKRMPPSWRLILPASVRLESKEFQTDAELQRMIYEHLSRRCAQREGLPTKL